MAIGLDNAISTSIYKQHYSSMLRLVTLRWHLIFKGQVQGVGFRWHICKLAQRLHVRGWVRNLSNGDVEAEVEGEARALDKLILESKTGLPLAQIKSIEKIELKPSGETGAFSIS